MTKNEKTVKQIFSALIPCNRNTIDTAFEKDPDLKKLLTTPGKDLPERYNYLISEELSDWENKTLLDLFTTFHGNKGETVVSNFSVAGEKVIGWVAYVVGHNSRQESIVTNLKMYSLIEKRNPVLLKDLNDMVYDLMEEYPEVRWLALKDNPANDIYRAFLNRVGGEIVDNGNTWIYRV